MLVVILVLGYMGRIIMIVSTGTVKLTTKRSKNCFRGDKGKKSDFMIGES
jgi:hypothetical protein